MLKKNVNRRWDASPSLPMLSAFDFNLEESPFSFFSGKWELYGSRYWVKGTKFKGLMVFFHGIGGGRTSYMRQIASCAQNGYLVYAYDNTGSMQSQGPGIYGLGQAVKDMRAFYSFLDQEEEAKGLKRYSMGHSWGGYVSMMSLESGHKVEKAVSFAGFVQPSLEYGFLAPILKNPFFMIYLKIFLRKSLGNDGDLSVIPVIKATSGSLFYIQGDKDTLVGYKEAYKELEKAFKNDPKVTLLSRPGVGHGCFSSKDAEEYREKVTNDGISSLTGPIGLHMDPIKATIEDPEIKKAVFDFFAK